MEKREIITSFLSRGVQIEPDLLDRLSKNPEETKMILDSLSDREGGELPPIVNTNYLESLLKSDKNKTTEGKTVKVSIIEEFSIEDRKVVGVEEFWWSYKKRYETLQKMLVDRMSGLKLTSINKIQTQKSFSLIVMIREKDGVEGSLLVEDTTGELRVFFDKNDIALKEEIDDLIDDDIIGVRCEKVDESVFLKAVFWPDIPIKKEITKTDSEAKALFINTIGYKNSVNFTGLVKWVSKTNFERLLIFCVDEKGEADEFISKLVGKNTETHTISRSGTFSIGGLKVMFLLESLIGIYGEKWREKQTIDIAQQIMKRRVLLMNSSDTKARILDDVPDVIVLAGRRGAESANYKGTSILEIGSFENKPEFWLMELSTREINKVDFS